jgi:hypothetical protein
MLSRFRTCCLISSLALLLACGDRGGLASGDSRERAYATDKAAAPALAPEVARAPAAPAQGASIASFWAAQKLIRSAQLRIEVKDVQQAVRSADSLVRQRGALVADSRLSQDAQDRRQAQLVIRVPSDRFAETIVALRQLGDVREEVLNTQDVTKDYADLETRLAVKEQTVARLRSLLDNRTAKLSDVLEVERELSRAVTELEQMKGEQRFYDQQIALSSLTLTLVDRAASRAVQFTGPIAAAFHRSLEVLGNSLAGLIYLITFLLPWVVLAIVLWWIVMRWRARGHRGPRNPTPAPPSSE